MQQVTELQKIISISYAWRVSGVQLVGSPKGNTPTQSPGVTQEALTHSGSPSPDSNCGFCQQTQTPTGAASPQIQSDSTPREASSQGFQCRAQFLAGVDKKGHSHSNSPGSIAP